MAELFEMHEIRRFLPLPYEEAMAPRLKRAQERLQGSALRRSGPGAPGTGPALLRICGLAGSIRAQGRTLVVVEDGGLSSGVQGLAGLLGDGDPGRVRFLGGLPPPGELREALELAAHGEILLLAAGRRDAPAAALLRGALEERYGGEAERHVLGGLPGDGEEGAGLFSAAGLLALAVLGVDVTALLAGAAAMEERCGTASFENPAWRYAAVRRQLCRSGFTVELLCCWDAALCALLEWAAGRFAAAEGKGGRALFPVAVDYSRAFCTLGQYIQEGPRLFVETAVRLEGDGDEPLSRLREAAEEGTMLSHTDHGVPNLILRPGGRTAEALGGLVAFLQRVCGLSACMGDADLFACPGVEDCEARIAGQLALSGGEGGRWRAGSRERVPAGIL